MLGICRACGFACDVERSRKNLRRLKLCTEHVALVLWQLVRHRFISQVVDGNSAAQVYVLQRVACLAVKRDEVFPHGLESLCERLNVWRLRAYVNVYAADVQEFGMLKGTSKSIKHIGVRDAELGSEKRCLQTKMRARANFRR